MRKIAANYILLPGFEFVKNGYVVLKDEYRRRNPGNSLSRILRGNDC